MTFFDLNYGIRIRRTGRHTPHQEFPGVPPPLPQMIKGFMLTHCKETVFDQSCLMSHQKRSRSVRINKKDKLGQPQGLISLNQVSIRKITNVQKYLCSTAMAEVTKYGVYT